MDKILAQIIHLTEEGKLMWEKVESEDIHYTVVVGNYTLWFFNEYQCLYVFKEEVELYVEESAYLGMLLNYPKETKELLSDLHLLDKGSEDIYWLSYP